MARSETSQAWKLRFRAPTVLFPHWAPAAPERLAVVGNESGAFQLYAVDLGSGERRRVTNSPNGVTLGFMDRDGERLAWFEDHTGDEVGSWLTEPFAGGTPTPLLPGVDDAWFTGLSAASGVVAAVAVDEDGYRVLVTRDGAPTRTLHSSGERMTIGNEISNERAPDPGGLSADGALVCVTHADDGDATHPALRVIDTTTGEVVAHLRDPGLPLWPAAWSPEPGDSRLVVTHEREGTARPAIWNPTTGERRDLSLDLPGEVSAEGWWPDASALLVVHEVEGQHDLLRLDLESGEQAPVADPGGTVYGAGVRPDGEVWFRAESGGAPPAVLDSGGREVIAVEGARPPAGRPYRSFWCTNPSGERIHGFVVTPPGEGPHPIVMNVHGGPDWAFKDAFQPDVQAFVDHGFAVGMVNYRGSTGYGTAFHDALLGNPGFPETEDTLAGLDHLIDEGVADPSRAAVMGRSWGGYVTLMALGLQPDRWRCGVAIVPVGDYLAAHYESSPDSQAWDRAFMGGGPEDLPDLYRERSPLTYVDRVTAPVLAIAGNNDPRCPIGQVLKYVDALRARGGEAELYRYEAGHASAVTDETIRQTELALDFLREVFARDRRG